MCRTLIIDHQAMGPFMRCGPHTLSEYCHFLLGNGLFEHEGISFDLAAQCLEREEACGYDHHYKIAVF